MAEVIIERRYAGPPQSGNGGYVAGVLARDITGPATAVLRAIIPLDTPLDLSPVDGRMVMTAADGGLIGAASPASAADLPAVPTPPSLAEAEAAGRRYLGHETTYHPICVSCATAREE